MPSSAPGWATRIGISWAAASLSALRSSWIWICSLQAVWLSYRRCCSCASIYRAQRCRALVGTSSGLRCVSLRILGCTTIPKTATRVAVQHKPLTKRRQRCEDGHGRPVCCWIGKYLFATSSPHSIGDLPCVRVLCLTYGRPLIVHAAMSQRQLVVPLAVDDEYLTRLPDAPGSQPDEIPSLAECYFQTVQLQDILGEVLTTLYHPDPNSSPGPSLSSGTKSVDFHKLFAVDILLTAWHKRLPPHLQVSQYKNSGEPLALNLSDRKVVYRRQATVLEVRYVSPSLERLTRQVCTHRCGKIFAGSFDDAPTSFMRPL